MSRLEMLLEQTEYLLNKQLLAKEHCSGAFADLLALMEEKIAQGLKGGQKVESLERVHDMLSGQAQKLMDDTQEDVEFLQEQIKALRGIRKMENAAKAQEALNHLIDPSEEIIETEEFIAGIDEEMAMSQEGFGFVISDIKDALLEGDIATVEAMLTTMATNDDLSIDLGDEEDEDDEEEDGCCGSGGCSTGGCGSCPTGCGDSEDEDGVDIFGQVSKYDRDLAKDAKNDSDKNKNGH